MHRPSLLPQPELRGVDFRPRRYLRGHPLSSQVAGPCRSYGVALSCLVLDGRHLGGPLRNPSHHPKAHHPHLAPWSALPRTAALHRGIHRPGMGGR